MRIVTGCRAGLIVAIGAIVTPVAVAVPASAQTSGVAPVKSERFIAVSCVSTRWCMAVGSVVGNTKHSLTAVWQSDRWQTVSAPPGRGLETVSCASAWHCVVTGRRRAAASRTAAARPKRTAVSQPGDSHPSASLDRGTVVPHSSPAAMRAATA
jgi:hypothetical protein